MSGMIFRESASAVSAPAPATAAVVALEVASRPPNLAERQIFKV